MSGRFWLEEMFSEQFRSESYKIWSHYKKHYWIFSKKNRGFSEGRTSRIRKSISTRMGQTNFAPKINISKTHFLLHKIAPKEDGEYRDICTKSDII